jgi:hypothetical protein
MTSAFGDLYLVRRAFPCYCTDEEARQLIVAFQIFLAEAELDQIEVNLINAE